MARNRKEHEGDSDGLTRNIARLRKETSIMVEAARESLKEDSHDPGMNAIKNAAEASPWGFSHWAVIIFAILAIALGVAILV